MSDPAPVLRDVYAAIAALWEPPEEGEAARRAAGAAIGELRGLDPEAAALLSRFLERPVAEDEYVSLFELDPRCPLYLGSHAFDEPKTCGQAAVCDRNAYMIDLLGLYRHLGLTPNGRELPDYLPLVVESLALSAGSDDPVRRTLIEKYILPFLPPVRARLEALKTPYRDLLDALERVLRLELGAGARG